MAKLSGKTVATLIAPRGTEDPEFTKPKTALEDAGATVVVVVVVVGLEPGKAETVNHDLDAGSKYPVDKLVGEATAREFDALVIPGGCVGADKLRGNAKAVAFVGDFLAASKAVGAICHAPWMLIEAGVVKGRTLTSYPTLKTDVENAGGNWVDQEVCSWVAGDQSQSRRPARLLRQAGRAVRGKLPRRAGGERLRWRGSTTASWW